MAQRRGKLLDKDGLGLGIMSQSILSILTSKTRLLEPTKRNLTLNLDCAVDLGGSSLEFLDNAHRTVDVLCKDSRRESKFGVVGLFDGFCFGLEGTDHDDGTKDFLLDDFCVGLGIEENGRLDEQTLQISFHRECV